MAGPGGEGRERARGGGGEGRGGGRERVLGTKLHNGEEAEEEGLGGGERARTRSRLCIGVATRSVAGVSIYRSSVAVSTFSPKGRNIVSLNTYH